MTALAGAVELLERALGYTRLTLADVRPELLAVPTPCTAWDLGRLLVHMEDALDAFTEAASGCVLVDASAPARTAAVPPVTVLRDKACALLGVWARAADEADRGGAGPGAPAGSGDVPGCVSVGGAGLASPLLVVTAALEVTVHGWDVGQATGARRRIPPDLARGLLEVARHVVDPAERGHRFAAARPAAVDADHDVRLLALLGREVTGPPRSNRAKPGTPPGLAS